nr:Glucose-signaling factor like [Ipomoea batatas]GME18068.1 Glucose-signaling factor like [Ipomoea batatas]
MALSTHCCLHRSSPPPTSSLVPPPPKTAPMVRQEKGRPWQNQLVIGMACVILGQEIGGAIVVAGDQEIALATGETPHLAGKPIKNVQIRWSEKRSCPPWQANSLETIVPENLPRPSSRRRWEIVGYSSRPAPSVKYVNKNIKQCFSL